jgi:hypothetical protein
VCGSGHAIIGSIERHWMPRESASYGNSSSSFQWQGDSTRAASRGIVALGGDGEDSTHDSLGCAEVGHGSAQGSGGDSGAVR